MSFDGKGRKTIREIQTFTEEKLANFETCGVSSKTRELFGKTSRVIFGTRCFEKQQDWGEGKGCLAQARRHVGDRTLAHYAHTAGS